MKVLSLFDGISCGMVALERAGIPVERYVAYEIDKYATEVSRNNYSFIEHFGDVFNGDFTQYKGFDLLLGGSPCTFWSVARRGREVTSEGMGANLFMQYVRALKESECKYFLYENNFSISSDIKDFISEKLGVRYVVIDSALVSAQSRKRCYWTNIPDVTQPKNKNICFKDILEDTESVPVLPVGNKAHTFSATYYKTSDVFSAYAADKSRQRLAVPLRVYESVNTQKPRRVFYSDDSGMCKIIGKDGVVERESMYMGLPKGEWVVRKLTPVEAERLQTLPHNYTLCGGVSDTQRYKCIGNGWTVDVIAHILKGLKKKEEAKAPLIGGLFDLFQ